MKPTLFYRFSSSNEDELPNIFLSYRLFTVLDPTSTIRSTVWVGIQCTPSYNILYTGILTNIILSYKTSIYKYFYEQLFDHTGILLNRYFDKQIHCHTVILLYRYFAVQGILIYRYIIIQLFCCTGILLYRVL